MPDILVQYRPSDPACQSFDKYIQVPDGATQDDIDAAAELALLETVRSGKVYTKGKKFCNPLDYSINYGPLLE